MGQAMRPRQRKEPSVSDTTEQPRVKFGNSLPTTKATLGGLTGIGWGMLLGGVLVMVVCLVVGWWLVGLLALFAGLLGNVFFIIRWGDLVAGRTLAARILDRYVDKKRGREGTDLYETGLFSALPDDALLALPGMLADLEEITGTDGEGEEYVLLHHRKTSRNPLLAATFSCRPDGTDLLPQPQIDQQVSKFGGWIASLSGDTSIEGAVVVVDSALESIEPLIAKIDAEVSPHAPAAAQRQLREGARALSGVYSDVEVFASVVWNVNKLATNTDDAVANIAAKLPGHRDRLAMAGAGSPVVATSSDLARAVRIAYRPDRAREFASDDLADRVSTLRITQAGPDFFDDSARRVCYHDGVASMTAMMVAPPQMHITEQILNDLFRPNGKFLRKRGAVYYRPMTQGKAFRTAQKIAEDASRNGTTVTGRRDVMAQRRGVLADKTLGDLQQGASMTAFAIQVTVTFPATEQGYREAETELKNLLEGAGDMTYRFVDTDTAAAFHSTLPLGVLPWAYATALQQVTDRTQ
ncbi:SCO6880 family protein [Curtobacterium sp. L1-20]|uniref:SCO6880 family protein n=1 Tax=Curtobacterium sp. L1-20 TaxID=3138181 RepID=UPI003B528919